MLAYHSSSIHCRVQLSSVKLSIYSLLNDMDDEIVLTAVMPFLDPLFDCPNDSNAFTSVKLVLKPFDYLRRRVLLELNQPADQRIWRTHPIQPILQDNIVSSSSQTLYKSTTSSAREQCIQWMRFYAQTTKEYLRNALHLENGNQIHKDTCRTALHLMPTNEQYVEIYRGMIEVGPNEFMQEMISSLHSMLMYRAQIHLDLLEEKRIRYGAAVENSNKEGHVGQSAW